MNVMQALRVCVLFYYNILLRVILCILSFSDLTLLVGRPEKHPAFKN